MSPEKNGRTRTTRRGFVIDIAAGAAAAAAAGVMQSALDPKGRNLMAAPEAVIPASAPGEPKYRKLFTTELRPEESEIGCGALKDMFMAATGSQSSWGRIAPE